MVSENGGVREEDWGQQVPLLQWFDEEATWRRNLRRQQALIMARASVVYLLEEVARLNAELASRTQSRHPIGE